MLRKHANFAYYMDVLALLHNSVLFRHECCYLLGQIGADSSDVTGVKKPVFLALLDVLEDDREDEVTRHEVRIEAANS